MLTKPRPSFAAKSILVAVASALALGTATIFFSNAAQSQSIDEQIAAQAIAVKSSQMKLKKLQEELAILKAKKSKNPSSDQWDANIEAVKSQIDNVSSDTELKMLRFRQLIDKRGTALQEAKETMQNDKKLKDQIVK